MTLLRVLGEFGKEAKRAILPLLKLLQDKDKYLRFQSALALAQIDPTRKECLPIFIEFLKAEQGPKSSF